jgi:uncharacterized damage-inducible protein DinB
MSLADVLLPEFDQEMATTRRVLERVPNDKGEWKPHEKSFSMAHLAQLVSMIPDWITQTLRKREINIAGGPGYSVQKTESLLEQFDRNVRGAREAIAATKDADFEVNWSLKMGDQVLYTQSRATGVRSHISHLVHHRAQLGIYLRLVNVPVPQMYGPTADEKWG